MSITEAFVGGYIAVAVLTTVACLAAALSLASSDNPDDRDDAATFLYYGVASILWLPLLAAAIARDTRRKTTA